MRKQVISNAFLSEIEKLALPRYEKAIQEGLISRQDVTPGVPELPGPLSVVSRKMSRNRLHAPAEVPAEQVERLRALREKLAPIQMQNAGQFVPGVVGSTEAVPGLVAGTRSGGGFFSPTTVHVPEEAGTLFRRYGEGRLGRLRALGASLASIGLTGSLGLRSFLGAAKPEDKSLRFAAGQHELGEASELKRRVLRPHASHAGVEPILREQLALQGDPAAVRAMARTRQVDPDDALVQKLIRRAGGAPDRPLAVGGRQQRAVERMLDQSVAQLQPSTRQRALMFQEALQARVPYVPKHVPGLDALLDKARKAPHAADRTRALADLVKDVVTRNRFIRKGV